MYLCYPPTCIYVYMPLGNIYFLCPSKIVQVCSQIYSRTSSNVFFMHTVKWNNLYNVILDKEACGLLRITISIYNYLLNCLFLHSYRAGILSLKENSVECLPLYGGHKLAAAELSPGLAPWSRWQIFRPSALWSWTVACLGSAQSTPWSHSTKLHLKLEFSRAVFGHQSLPHPSVIFWTLSVWTVDGAYGM